VTTPAPSPIPTAPPPQIVLSYVTVAVLLCVGVGILVFSVAFHFRYRAIGAIRENASFRSLSFLLEPVIAVALSLIAGFSDMLKPEKWGTPTALMVIAAPLWTGLTVAYVALKYFASVAKDKDAEEIKKLKEEVGTAQTRAAKIEEQRNFITRMTQYVREPVQAKLERLLEAFRKQPFTEKEYLAALSPHTQVQLILNTIYEFFRSDLPMGEKMRLGLFMRQPDNPKMLFPAYSYNGQRDDGVFSAIAHGLRIDDPNGTKSMLAQTYLSDRKLHIVPSCREAAKREEFHYLHVAQNDYLRSMLAYKHVWLRDGEPDAFVLTLDTTCDGFFGRYSAESIEPFLIEMMKRVEYEVLSLQMQKALAQTAHTT
jgi:hypothetical protein